MDASPITPDRDEALRYAGVRADESGDMHRKMAEIAAQCMKTVTPRCTYRVSEIAWENGMPSLFGGQLVLPGRTAAVMRRSCSHAALPVCTLGTTFDALARQEDVALVDGAANGAEALKLLCQRSYDVMVTDIIMPVMDGYTLMQEMRKVAMKAVDGMSARRRKDDGEGCRTVKSSVSSYLYKHSKRSPMIIPMVTML